MDTVSSKHNVSREDLSTLCGHLCVLCVHRYNFARELQVAWLPLAFATDCGLSDGSVEMCTMNKVPGLSWSVLHFPRYQLPTHMLPLLV